jgi:circadian clock protein KaiB
MIEKQPDDLSESFEKALQKSQSDHFVLRLYISGNTAKSAQAILNLRKICELKLNGRYHLEVIDISQNPGLAKSEQIIATPTLIKSLPVPLRRIIGDLSHIEQVLIGLDILPRDS